MGVSKEKLIQIKKEIHNCRLDLEEKEHKNIHEAPKPTFKPNKKMGEGTVSKTEMKYRQALMTPFKSPYNKIKKIIKGNSTDEQKKKDIDATLQSFRGQINFKKIVESHIYDINSSAIDKANKELKALEKEKKESLTIIIREANDNKYRPDQALLLSPLLLQQWSNIENILDDLEADIDQAWQRCAIIKQTRPNYVCPFDEYLDDSFYRTQNRTDGMGWYGWFKSNEAGLLATFMMSAAVLGSLVADWVSMGDDRVCEDCLELEANSPYLLTEWPQEPHFGCRCEMQNIRLAGSNN